MERKNDLERNGVSGSHNPHSSASEGTGRRGWCGRWRARRGTRGWICSSLLCRAFDRCLAWYRRGGGSSWPGAVPACPAARVVGIARLRILARLRTAYNGGRRVLPDSCGPVCPSHSLDFRCSLAGRGAPSVRLGQFPASQGSAMKWLILASGRSIGGILIALMGGCQLSGPVRPHTVLGAEAQELRTAFNADTGMVRVVLLVAPT